MSNAFRWIRENLDVKHDEFSDDYDGQIYVNCPFCQDRKGTPDEKYHMGILLSMQSTHCFRCDYRGPLIKLVQDFAEVTYVEALRMIGGKSFRPALQNLSMHTDLYDPKAPTTKLPEEYMTLNPHHALHFAAWKYLRKRGYNEETISHFELGYCYQGDYAQRIILPIRFKGEIVGFTGRTILEDEKPKYKNPPADELKISQWLYNYDQASFSEVVVIVEGPVDTWKLPYSAVALFTKTMSEAQKLLIVNTWKQAVILLDKTATADAIMIQRALNPFLFTKIAVLPKSKDPGEAPWKEIVKAIKNASGNRDFGDYLYA